MATPDTIVAIATAAGPAGVGIVRLSGPRAAAIADAVCGPLPPVRQARHVRFRGADGEVLDDGLVLRFAAPASFTGEDVVEFQGHGSPVLLTALVARCVALGARAARPGEFSERAFLNGKLDLAQAEAVADLIGASSLAAARAARRSLEGAFSRRVEALAEALTALRVWIEAAIDFPEEEIDFLADAELLRRRAAVAQDCRALLADAERGRRLVDGLHAVIVGAPNAGKSSLLNVVAGHDRAIVTEIAGTTRDVLREAVSLGGVGLTLVDTAGLRESDDPVEREGIRRAHREVGKADLVLAVVDESAPDPQALADALREAATVLWVHTKIDLAGAPARTEWIDGVRHVWLSARTGEGLDLLAAALAEHAGQGDAQAGTFSARARHVEALRDTSAHVDAAGARLAEGHGELAAEELRLAQDALGGITGRVSSDALLGRVFASFCIGK
ncbi:tRNA uridine-5-carboxymethylaminomethyl(34) synthesis GTPase MnmE [Coralloluteibacterium thermophilus]|uniref:tRNA modification GTPase MnmE n=1 Tax=Coralloluteibacterium thermophilum TaxID=2707049 RepID=A0ABV9NLD1_9GAMM